MTRTNPSKTKPRMDKTTDRKRADRKQIIFTEGAKGGGGKTTLLSSLADFFLAESIPVKLVGLGEGPDDLAPFEPKAFVDALLGSD